MNTKNIKAALQNHHKVKLLKDPEQRHQFVLHWNWDDGVEPLQWIVEQPDTDKGTALYVYWLSEPGRPHNEDEISTLISTIENNIKKDFYKNENILFDLSKEGIDSIKVNKESIPQEMFQATKGKTVAIKSLEYKYVNKIYPLSEQDEKKLERNIAEGLTSLQEFDKTITAESSPDTIVQALQKITNAYRVQNNGKFSPQESKMFKKLDYLWADQVCKKYGYSWYLHEVHEQVLDFVEFVIVSPDKKYFWHDLKDFIKGYSQAGEGTLIVDKFKEFEDLDTKVEGKLAEYKAAHPDHTEDQILIFARPYPNGISATKYIQETQWE